MIRAILFMTVGVLSTSTSLATPSAPLSLVVDASDAARRLLHSEFTFPVHPGRLTLVYPRWAIPTYEAPNAIVDDIVDLRFTAKGKRVEWHRDPLDMFSFIVTVPKGVSSLTVTMDVVAAPQRSDFNATTGQLLILNWNTVLLYPKGAAASAVRVSPRLRLPAGWKQACAMKASELEDGELEYPTTTLATLIDSPVLAGKFFSTTRIQAASASPVFVDIAADSAEAAALSDRWRQHIRRVVDETSELFGGVPYEHYDFLLALSAEVGNDGVEHRQSSDIRLGMRGLVDEANRLAFGYLVPHEYVHAWNGKFRIPAGLVRRNYEEPQTSELLWVYEGLTRYLNWVLAARSGILTVAEARDYAALLAAKTVYRSGRDWRSLQDTAVSAGILNDAPDQWESLRRSTDYYDEALLIWLDADTTIRRLTRGTHSLDDFCRAFFGPPKNAPAISQYTFEDIILALKRIAPYDWRRFLRSRLDATGVENAPLAGLTASGWALRNGSAPGSAQAARDQVNHTVEERFSVGIRLQEDGTIIDVVRNSPAWKSGLWPGMRLQTINGRPWSADALRTAISEDANTTTPLRITAQNGAESFVALVDDHGGARYPQLFRNDRQDLMGEILTPRTRAADAR
jgi:predicted metalloprotease with PDZ domain